MLAMLAAVMLAAAPQHDTVFTADGGRVVGTVVEDSAQSVAVQLPDGTFRRLPRRDVVRIEYADGSVSSRPPAPAAPPAAAAQPQPPASPPPPPAYAPPPPPSYRPAPYYGRPMPPPQWAAPATTGPVEPFWLTLGVGGMFYGGNARPGFSARGEFGPQVNLNFEGGFRLNPYLGLGLYADLGVGGPGTDVQNDCNSQGFDCTATTSRVGLVLRHTFSPYSRATPWISVGTGYAQGSVEYSGNGSSGTFFDYSGWEMVRLMGGVDVRSSQVIGFGLYAGVGFTRFSDYRDNSVGSVSLPKETTHTMVEAGVRLTLFP